jgi:hypothetical protein
MAAAVVAAPRRTVASATLLGCAQTGSYAPKPVTATYRLENFSKWDLQVVVRDLRAERSNSMELVSAIQSQISNALAEKASLCFIFALASPACAVGINVALVGRGLHCPGHESRGFRVSHETFP